MTEQVMIEKVLLLVFQENDFLGTSSLETRMDVSQFKKVIGSSNELILIKLEWSNTCWK